MSNLTVEEFFGYNEQTIKEIERRALIIVAISFLGLSQDIGDKLRSLPVERVEVLYKRLGKLLEGGTYLETTFSDNGEAARVVAYSPEIGLKPDENGDLDWVRDWEMDCERVSGSQVFKMVEFRGRSNAQEVLITRENDKGLCVESSELNGHPKITTKAHYGKLLKNQGYKLNGVDVMTISGEPEQMTIGSGVNSKGQVERTRDNLRRVLIQEPSILYKLDHLEGPVVTDPNFRDGLLSRRILDLFELVEQVSTQKIF